MKFDFKQCGYYGRDEIIAFAKGMADRTKVKVLWKDGLPRTNGTTVWIDCSPCTCEQDYIMRTGHADHEIAHVWFQTCANTSGWAKQFADRANAPWAEFAAHECVNIIVDIADETRMIRLLPYVAGALKEGNTKAMERIRTGTDCLTSWRAKCLWGILYARIELPCEDLERSLRQVFGADWKNDRILRICKNAREQAPKLLNPKRSASGWKKLETLSEELFKIILPNLDRGDQMAPRQKPIEPPPMDDDAMDAASAAALVSQTNRAKQSPDEAAAHDNDVGARIREAAMAYEQGYEVPDVIQGVQPPTHPQAKLAGQTCGFLDFGSAASRPHLERCRRTINSVIDEMMLTDHSMRQTRHENSGDTMGKRWVNLHTNGNIFVRKEPAPNYEMNLAMLMDCSTSMNDSESMPFALAAAAAMAEASAAHGATVAMWRFGSKSNQRRITWESLIKPGVKLEPSTHGAHSLEQATRWLMGKSTGRRICVCVTDGQWDDASGAARIILNGSKFGIEYVFIGIDLTKMDEHWPQGMPFMSCERGNAAQLAELLRRAVWRRR